MADPNVSVIIPNYNYSQYLGEAIDSVLAQTHAEIEIIVVDDGSSDDSREVIESYGERITAIFQKNAGVSAARNNGVTQSRGKFLAFLDADDAWSQEKIERQLAMFEQGTQLGLVHVGVIEIDGDGNSLIERIDGMSGQVADALLSFDGPVILGGGSGLMVPRRIFDEIGGFDTRLSTSADWDCFYRISRRYNVGFVPEILLKYRVHSSNMHSNIRTMENDMLLGFAKAFSEGQAKGRSKCFGNLHKVLAGSYFRNGKYADFMRHALKSVLNRPANLGYFLKFPLRRLQNK